MKKALTKTKINKEFGIVVKYPVIVVEIDDQICSLRHENLSEQSDGSHREASPWLHVLWCTISGYLCDAMVSTGQALKCRQN